VTYSNTTDKDVELNKFLRSLLKVIPIITLGIFGFVAWLFSPYFLSESPEDSIVKRTTKSEVIIDITKTNSLYYQQTVDSSEFHQAGEQAVIVSSGSEVLLSMDAFSTHIEYKKKIFDLMRFNVTQRSVTRVSLSILIKKWFGHDEELKAFAMAVLVASLGSGKYPKLLQRRGFEINFNTGCKDIEYRYEALGNGCRPRVSVGILKTPNK
jgi:hypothetical protein